MSNKAIRLENVDDDKMVPVIKLIRAVAGFSLRDAKQITDRTPSIIYPIFSDLSSKELEKLFKEAGATVSFTYVYNKGTW